MMLSPHRRSSSFFCYHTNKRDSLFSSHIASIKMKILDPMTTSHGYSANNGYEIDLNLIACGVKDDGEINIQIC